MATRPLKQAQDRGGEGLAAGGFTIEDVKKLVQLVEKTDITHIAWRNGPDKVVIRRGVAAATNQHKQVWNVHVVSTRRSGRVRASTRSEKSRVRSVT